MALNFEQLLAKPPALKEFTSQLPDGRDYILHQLPMAVLADIYAMSVKAQSEDSDLDFTKYAEISAQSMLGRKAKPEEVQAMIETLGNDTVLHIYKDALRFSNLGEEAVEEAKKD